MDMQSAVEGEEAPDLAQRMDRVTDTMQSIARNLAAVDSANRGAENKMNDIISGLDSLVNVVLPGLAKEFEKLHKAMSSCMSKYLFYYGHRIRLVNESNWEPWVIEQLKSDPELFAVECDWAMKV